MAGRLLSRQNVVLGDVTGASVLRVLGGVLLCAAVALCAGGGLFCSVVLPSGASFPPLFCEAEGQGGGPLPLAAEDPLCSVWLPRGVRVFRCGGEVCGCSPFSPAQGVPLYSIRSSSGTPFVACILGRRLSQGPIMEGFACAVAYRAKMCEPVLVVGEPFAGSLSPLQDRGCGCQQFAGSPSPREGRGQLRVARPNSICVTVCQCRNPLFRSLTMLHETFRGRPPCLCVCSCMVCDVDLNA